MQSTHIQQFLALSSNIDDCTTEAMSNIEFLALLKLPCDDMNDIQNPEAMSVYLPKILHLFRLIWLHSPYYNTDERIQNLIGLINNQIVSICQKFIDVQDILTKGKTRQGIEILSRCIQTCESYKELYFKVIYIIYLSHLFLFEQSTSFNYFSFIEAR